MKDEFILSYPKATLLKAIEAQVLESTIVPLLYGNATLYSYVGAQGNGFKAFAEVFDGLTSSAAFKRREELEKSLDDIHPIPYFAYERADGSLYVYQRGKETEEGRLAGDDSVAPGGHVEVMDASSGIQFVPYLHAFAAALDDWLSYGVDLKAMVTALIREAYEEVGLYPTKVESVNEMVNLDAGFGIRFIGALYDQSNDVGKQHLGLLFVIRIPNNMDVRSQEKVIIDRGFFPPAKILSDNVLGHLKLENWSKVFVEHLINEKSRLANNA